MSGALNIAQMPTLRELYQRGTLTTTSRAPRYASASALLDRISLHKGDLTKLEVDAIVNAANRRLLGGGGVDGAIHRAAGKELLEECKALNGCDTGDAKITKGYELPARHVIHTVGPVYSNSKEGEVAKLLASCYRRSLEVASSHALTTIAFPCISTGIYGYPVTEATHIALNEVRQYLESSAGKDIERVIFVVFLPTDAEVYNDLLPLYFPLPEESPSV